MTPSSSSLPFTTRTTTKDGLFSIQGGGGGGGSDDDDVRGEFTAPTGTSSRRDDKNDNNMDGDETMTRVALLDDILKVAVEASEKAATIIARHADGADVVATKSTPRDLLTLIDPLCERAIRDTIQATFPHHAILGEEGVTVSGIDGAKAALEEKLQETTTTNDNTNDGGNGGGWLWIVDPIDGTTNFASGIPLSAPSVAVAHRGEIVVGVIHDPHRPEVWTAVRGQGAFLNGNRIQSLSAGSAASTRSSNNEEATTTTTTNNDGDDDTPKVGGDVVALVTELADAVIGAESPAGQESLRVALKGIRALMPNCRTVRILGSTAVSLPWVVAGGRLTCYWSPDECAWDHAAGALIVQEAGGVITDLDGSPFTLRTRKFLASQNDVIHQQVLKVLREAGCIEII